jgi:hypothetical protein
MRRILAMAIAASMCLAAWAQSPEATTGMGTWKLNIEKSRFNPGPAPKGLVTRFEPSGKGVSWTAERTLADGTTTKASYTGLYDGKEYPLSGSPTADAIVMRRIDGRTTERINMKAGKVVTTERRTVAADGRSYTTTVKGTTAKGEPIDHLMVFDKQ